MINLSETLTLAIVTCITYLISSSNQGNLISTTCDWKTLGIVYGFHLSKWAQSVELKNYLPLLTVESFP